MIGVEAELFPSMYNRINGTDMPCAGDTLAEGIAVKEPGGITARMVEALVDDIVLVSERSLEEAVSLLLQIEKTVVEGAGAAGLAALLAYPERFKGKTVGVVLCGGNIDTRLLANVLLRDLARSGRLARLRIRLQDQPGALFNVARIFDAAARQHHRGLSPARLHHAAGQGPDHRHRMRDARPRASRPADAGAARRAATRSARSSWPDESESLACGEPSLRATLFAISARCAMCPLMIVTPSRTGRRRIAMLCQQCPALTLIHGKAAFHHDSRRFITSFEPAVSAGATGDQRR